MNYSNTDRGFTLADWNCLLYFLASDVFGCGQLTELFDVLNNLNVSRGYVIKLISKELEVIHRVMPC